MFRNAIKKSLIAVSVGIAVAAIPVVSYASHSWANYHWARTANPFTLKVTNSMTSEWQASFNGTISAWNTPIGTNFDALNFNVVTGSTNKQVRRQCRPKAGQIIACNLAYGQNGWLGLASINIDGSGHITQGSAKMNDSYSSYWGIAGERNHVVCQEIGHLFGLGHTSEDGSSQQTCMDYSSGVNSQWPNAHDFEQLKTIYNHIDTYTTVTSGSSAASAANLRQGGIPAEVAQGILVQKNPRFEVWVASDGAGGYWIHHVRLVPEAFRHN